MTFLSCSYAAICSGCDWLLLPGDEQRAEKIQNFHEATGLSLDVDFISIANGGLRDRVDLMFDRRSGSPRLGLFDRFRTGIVDLQGCPQLSPQLEKWLQEFRLIEFPIERGSIRLRVSPRGLKGAWLDFANVDVKNLLDERTTLDRLRATGAVIEIGQKRKRLVERGGVLKLDEPVLEKWFETYSNDTAVDLYCMIGSFTQPGFRANRVLIQEATKQAKTVLSSGSIVAEFGSGIGNFTLPLAAIASEVRAYEVDTLALEGLSRSAAESNLESKIKVFSGNFQAASKTGALDFHDVDLLFVDPPRSGLMSFLDPVANLTKDKRPKAIVYVSCFAESFGLDAKRLEDLGYSCTKATLVDQFPQSRHYEIAATFQLG